LARFDAIFTLNQDVLLECRYLQHVELAGTRRWSGVQMPGMHPSEAAAPDRWGQVKWQPATETFAIAPRTQPVFKLHGSSNWVDESGHHVLIMGGNKIGAIAENAVLSQYHDEFSRRLRGGARLMVIGYGFRDDHINHALVDAHQAAKMFIIDPYGADAIAPPRPGQIQVPPRKLREMIIGASRRSLREIFGGDAVERAKVMRFFHS
jgi:hypothetical protein